jgi:GR25 family glycosyltransferase involved in LPS biosynthesis
MKNLTDFFDKVYVINCQHRPDRLEKIKKELLESSMADLNKVIFYRAIVGDFTTCPADWNSGKGAWGCLKSHQRILEDVMHERDENGEIIPKSTLILEDDVFFVDGALEKLNNFMNKVPEDWGQIYLGGQHRAKKLETKEKEVVIGLSVNRTHAYAVNTSCIQQIYRHISYASDYRGTNKHIDHQLELAHRRLDWRVYCPTDWICGQEAGSSNISGKTNERKIW